MANIFRELLIWALVTVSVVVGQNRPVGGAGGFNCPRADGQFEFPGDCTQFYQCDGGVGTQLSCQHQLIFNAQAGFCDWPHNVQNPNCANVERTGLTAQNAQLCRTVPPGVQPTQAFNVGHPDLCNAFYTCSPGYLFAPCTFCGEGLYFSREAGGCRDYVANGLDRNAVCQGRQFIEHNEKVFSQMDGVCWPYVNPTNPFQNHLNAIRAGRQG